MNRTRRTSRGSPGSLDPGADGGRAAAPDADALAALPIQTLSNGVRFDVQAMPRAPRTAVDGIRDGRLVVRVTAPPVDAAANDAVVATLARALDVPRRDVRIVSGAAARRKTVEVAGLDAGAVRQRLARAAGRVR